VDHACGPFKPAPGGWALAILGLTSPAAGAEIDDRALCAAGQGPSGVEPEEVCFEVEFGHRKRVRSGDRPVPQSRVRRSSDQGATSRPRSGWCRSSIRAGARTGSAVSANKVTAICAGIDRFDKARNRRRRFRLWADFGIWRRHRTALSDTACLFCAGTPFIGAPKRSSCQRSRRIDDHCSQAVNFDRDNASRRAGKAEGQEHQTFCGRTRARLPSALQFKASVSPWSM
jgi:hypothetical protein